jgi:hypothetical protein
MLSIYVDQNMLGGFCKMNSRIHLWVFELCKPLVLLQVELLTLDVYVWISTIRSIQESHEWGKVGICEFFYF